MKVKLLKNWGDYKKDDVLEIIDETLLNKGFDTKLFIEIKEK